MDFLPSLLDEYSNLYSINETGKNTNFQISDNPSLSDNISDIKALTPIF